MQSFKQAFKVGRVTDHDRLFRPDWHEYGVFNSQPLPRRAAATFDSIQHAERLCAMLNDTNFECERLFGLGKDLVADTKRLVMTLKLFCLQENLTWADCGFAEDEIRNVNEFLEMPIDLRQTKEN